MAPDTNTVYVVTGGNRGIGLGLVKSLLARPSTTVFASVRNDNARSKLEAAIASAPKGNDSVINIVQLEISSSLPPDQICKAFNIDHIDVLINNAAIACHPYSAVETPAEDLRLA
ncbi:hypothetical protein F66182_4507, partial [Fusarium sp. NRRL 66182]